MKNMLKNRVYAYSLIMEVIMSKTILFIGILSLMFAIGCSDTPEGPLTGELNLYIQDGVADYDSVFLTIDSIATRSTLPSSNWITIFAGSKSFDLASLRNGNKFLLLQRDFPVGEIGWIKITFSGGHIVVDGDTYELQFPDTVSVPGIAEGTVVITKDQIASALIDVNLFSSISYNSTDDIYAFDPVIKFINIDSSGAIFGTTSPRVDIYIFEADSTDTLSYTLGEGNSNAFGFFGLPQGFYDILCLPRGADTLTYQPLLNENIPVIAGNEYDMGLLELISR